MRKVPPSSNICSRLTLKANLISLSKHQRKSYHLGTISPRSFLFFSLVGIEIKWGMLKILERARIESSRSITYKFDFLNFDLRSVTKWKSISLTASASAAAAARSINRKPTDKTSTIKCHWKWTSNFHGIMEIQTMRGFVYWLNLLMNFYDILRDLEGQPTRRL